MEKSTGFIQVSDRNPANTVDSSQIPMPRLQLNSEIKGNTRYRSNPRHISSAVKRKRQEGWDNRWNILESNKNEEKFVHPFYKQFFDKKPKMKTHSF